MKRQVAVKILPPGFTENPQAVKRFLHEGQLAASLDRANIVTVFEAGEDNGNFYIDTGPLCMAGNLGFRLSLGPVLPVAAP